MGDPAAGRADRGDALRLESAQAMRVVLVVVATLGVADMLEAFVSPTSLLLGVKLAVGLGSGALLWAYILLAGRRDARSLR